MLIRLFCFRTTTIFGMLRLPIIGHQGGWDEILMVVAPIAIIWAVLAVANKRAKKRNESLEETT
tara:strand:- start:1040 stop:1231 length:192 start_codon:yes stop_codon:yes gene_type:complete